MSQSNTDTAGGLDANRPETGGEPQTDDRSPAERREPARPSFIAGVLAMLKPRVPALLRTDLAEALLDESGDGAFSSDERAMLKNILRLREVRVEDVMVPRAEIEAVEITATLGELMRAFESSGHSRMPVYGDDLDDLRGMVHIRDVLAHITGTAGLGSSAAAAEAAGDPTGGLDLQRVDLSLEIGTLGIIREVLFVPPSMLASNLMTRMQATRTQMALVIDEYGGTDGLVSLEDVIEMVVGNIEDEHDTEEVLITARGDGVYYADARADLQDVRKLVGSDFDVTAFEEEADTIGGLLFYALGRVPTRGEVVQAMSGFEFQVLEADPRRVLSVLILRKPLTGSHAHPLPGLNS